MRQNIKAIEAVHPARGFVHAAKDMVVTQRRIGFLIAISRFRRFGLSRFFF
jgi:hypothetical protein